MKKSFFPLAPLRPLFRRMKVRRKSIESCFCWSQLRHLGRNTRSEDDREPGEDFISREIMVAGEQRITAGNADGKNSASSSISFPTFLSLAGRRTRNIESNGIPSSVEDYNLGKSYRKKRNGGTESEMNFPEKGDRLRVGILLPPPRRASSSSSGTWQAPWF